VEKADLSNGYQNPKRKLGVARHFSKIIELKFGKKLPYILCILKLFWNYGCLAISGKCVVTHILLLKNRLCPNNLVPNFSTISFTTFQFLKNSQD